MAVMEMGGCGVEWCLFYAGVSYRETMLECMPREADSDAELGHRTSSLY
jgi:hypothetical protein